MRITPDTNILVRVVLRDDKRQSEIAETILREADLIAIPLPALCEFVWVLDRGRKASSASICAALHQLLSSSRVQTNRPAVLAGISNMEAGGGFADAVIAFEGQQQGGDVFVTFDKDAANRLSRSGIEARLLS